MISRISAEKLKEKMDKGEDFRLVEVLLAEKYNEWHLPNAINIPKDELKIRAPHELAKDDEIIVYCKGFECKASTMAAEILTGMGYKKVIDYKGGKEEWEQKDYPRES